jgi:hypothetical protein
MPRSFEPYLYIFIVVVAILALGFITHFFLKKDAPLHNAKYLGLIFGSLVFVMNFAPFGVGNSFAMWAGIGGSGWYFGLLIFPPLLILFGSMLLPKYHLIAALLHATGGILLIVGYLSPIGFFIGMIFLGSAYLALNLKARTMN